MKVRSHLALTVAAAMLPLVLFASLGIGMLLEGERTAAIRGVKETARAAALSLDQKFSNAETALKVLATSQSIVNGDLAGFYRQAKESNTDDEQWTVLFDRDGYQLVNTRVPFGTLLPRRAHPEYGLEIMLSKKTRVTDLAVGPLSGKYVVAIDAPVPFEDGQKYVISQTYPPEYFHRVITAQPIPANWPMSISDRKGIIIARSHMAQTYVGKSVIPALAEAIQLQNSGVLRTRSLEGIEIYSVFDKSTLSGWTVAIGVPVAEIEQTARKVVIFSVIGFLVALCLAATAALFFGRKLVNAIRGIEEAASGLAHGGDVGNRMTGITEVDHLQSVLLATARALNNEREFRIGIEKKLQNVVQNERDARNIADTQNQAKDEFLAMLGHELRNPLAPISAAASLMQIADISEERIKKSNAIILRQVKHMTALLDDLLDVSRVTRGLVLLEKMPVDMKSAVSNAVEQVSSLVKDNGHQFDISFTSEETVVLGDEKRLIQITTNLLSNAIRYTPKGGHITLALDATDDEIVLVVADDGVGVPQEMQQQIFELFVQGKRSIDRSQGGLGLGLALVKRLVEVHSGKVICISNGLNQGSQFKVTLPRHSLPSPLHANLAAQVADRNQERLTILIVDDNDDAAQLLGALLDAQGHAVKVTNHAYAALEFVKKETFDVILSDIGLPEMDGYDFARAVRQHPNGLITVLIATTGYGKQSDIEQAYAAGFNHHLVKPVDISRLFELLPKSRPETRSFEKY